MTRSELTMRYAELKLDNALAELRKLVPGVSRPEADPLTRYADPEPPRGVTLPGWKRSRWARRLLGR